VTCACAADAPFKQTCFPQYAVPDALERYAEVADALNLDGKTREAKVRCRTWSRKLPTYAT